MSSLKPESAHVCPKCAALSREGETTCSNCGVIFAKVRRRPTDPAPVDPLAALTSAEEPASSLVSYARAAFLALLGYLTFRFLSHPIASNYVGESFLHLVILPFHEAGHVLFSPFGRFLQVAGGTLMQLIVPAAVAISFFRRRDRFGAAVGIWWLGESLVDVAPYANDARAGQLMLLGGVTGSEVEDYHDWEVMLGRLNMLSWDHALARCFFVAGGAVMIAALLFAALATWRLTRTG